MDGGSQQTPNWEPEGVLADDEANTESEDDGFDPSQEPMDAESGPFVEDAAELETATGECEVSFALESIRHLGGEVVWSVSGGFAPSRALMELCRALTRGSYRKRDLNDT